MLINLNRVLSNIPNTLLDFFVLFFSIYVFTTLNADRHRQRIINWIDSTGQLSSAFDFTTKGILQV